MIPVAVSQRVDVTQKYAERRDALDQRWAQFLFQAGVLPILIPNDTEVAGELLRSLQPAGVLLTGGNDLEKYGGNAPERDNTETLLIRYALQESLPLLGVCRGMQSIQDCFGVRLIKVEGHVTPRQVIKLNGVESEVNSYHNYGSRETVAELQVCGVAQDGVIKAIRHVTKPVAGIMWHPERINPFRNEDLTMVEKFFSGKT